MSGTASVRRAARGFARRCGLSPRQAELLTFSAEGVHRKEAAARLGCSLKTVEGYWKRIYEKTGAKSEGELIARVFREAVSASVDERDLRLTEGSKS